MESDFVKEFSPDVRPSAAALPERLRAPLGDWTMGLLRTVNDATLHVVIALDGLVDEARLGRAVRLLLDAEPVLGCRFVPRAWRPHWQRRDDLDHVPLCRRLESPGPTELGNLLADPVDPQRDPLVRLTILRGQTDTLWLRISHLAADGAGARECAHLLAGIYRALGADAHYCPAPNLDGRRSLGQVRDQFGLLDRLRMVRQGLRYFQSRWNPPTYWSVPSAPGVQGDSPGATYVLQRIAPSQVNAMRSYARARGATLNDLLSAAYVRALIELIRPGDHVPLRLRLTADLRRYLPGRRAGGVCNLSAFAYLNLGPGPHRSLDQLVDRVRDELSAQKRDLIGLGEPALLAPLVGCLPYAWLERGARHQARRPWQETSEELRTPTFTNFGPFDPARLDFGPLRAIDAFLTAPIMYPPGFALAASGYGESITLSAGFCESGIPRGRVQRLLTAMTAELPGA